MNVRGRRLTGIVLAAAGLLLIGCSGSDRTTSGTSAYRVVTKATLHPGDRVPTPTGPVVLTIDGAIDNPNVGEQLQFDMTSLEALGLVEYRVDDYQAEGKHVLMRGPLLASVLAVAGAPDTARTLRTVALNDYKVTIPMSDVKRFPVVVATRVNGKRMPVDRYGPIRVVYPNLSTSFDKALYDPRWIWQLSAITVS